MRERDIRYPSIVEADLISVCESIAELQRSRVKGAQGAIDELERIRRHLRTELMQGYFDQYAKGIDLDGCICLKSDWTETIEK